MDLDLDSGTILYALGVLFGLAAVLYFLRDVVFDLSITVRGALLFLAFLAFLLAGFVLQRDVLDLVAFAFAAIAYVGWVLYVLARYQPSDTLVFLLLATSAALFVGLAYALREHDVAVSRRTALVALGVLALVGAVLVGADALGGGVAYDTTMQEEVVVEPADDPGPDDDVVPGRPTDVGTVTATNEFVFRRPLDLPRPSSCLVGGDGAVSGGFVNVGGDAPPDSLGAYETLSVPLSLQGVELDADAGPTTVAVERGTDCDVEREQPTLVVSFQADLRPRPR